MATSIRAKKLCRRLFLSVWPARNRQHLPGIKRQIERVALCVGHGQVLICFKHVLCQTDMERGEDPKKEWARTVFLEVKFFCTLTPSRPLRTEYCYLLSRETSYAKCRKAVSTVQGAKEMELSVNYCRRMSNSVLIYIYIANALK